MWLKTIVHTTHFPLHLEFFQLYWTHSFTKQTSQHALNLHKEGSLLQIYLLQAVLIQDATVLFAELLFKPSFLPTCGAVFCLLNRRQQNIFYHYCR